MLKHALMATAITFASLSAQAQVVLLSENFDDVANLNGWLKTYESTPGGSTQWYQGDQTLFAAQAGSSESYIAANYNSAPANGQIKDWLITPVFSTELRGEVTFWAKADLIPNYADKVSFGFSNGSSNTASFALGAVTTVAGDWTKYTVSYAAQGVGSTARFAILYSGAADQSNYVGIDTLKVTAVPEPTTWALMAIGLAGVALRGRRALAKRVAT
jgi:PEP-CTERM motif